MKKLHTTFKGIIVTMLFLVILIPGRAQKIDTEYQNKIAEYTTDSCFLSSIVSKIPLNKEIPSPLEFFGSIIGAPGVIHRTNEVYDYFKALAKSTDKLKIEQIGTSEEGRPINMVTISSESNMEKLDYYNDIMSKLADPRKTNTAAAEKMINDGKVVYFLNGGMHSSEMGSCETLMEVAYRLVADESEDVQSVLENCIVLMNPVSEPDGRDKQTDWYYRYTINRKEYNDGFSRSAPYWGKYVFHDNNRDGFQISQEITKAIFKIYYDWHPTVMLDLHESVPLLYISTGTGPYNANIDPITVSEWQTFANNELTALSVEGMPGGFDWAYYDGWYPGYGLWIANNHNSIGRFYETFGNAGGDTYLRDLSNSQFAGDKITSREWYRPDPATEKLYWSSRNNVNYTETGVLTSLFYAAKNKSMLLSNFYQKGINSINYSKTKDVKMFVIPEEQRDPVMAAYLVNQLRAQGIEVRKVKDSEREYVVLLDQPYSRFACDLLLKQKYPSSAKFPPHDAIAWTLGLMYGVDVQECNAVKYSYDELSMVTEDVKYIGSSEGEGSDYLINYKAQSSVLPGLYSAADKYKNFKAEIIDSETTVGKDTLSAGSLILKGLNKSQAKELSGNFGLDLVATKSEIKNTREISLPKIAVYHTWTSTQGEGWVRFTLDQKKIPYTSIDKDDLKDGMLRKRFDLIIIPKQWGGLSSFINGVDEKFGPMPFTKTKEFPSHGYPDSTEDMTGGPGFEGLNNLSQFVKEGGILVPLENSAGIIAEAGIGREVSSFTPAGLFHPGSIVTAKARNTGSPILYGYPETLHLFRGNGSLLSTRKYNRDLMVLQYGTKPLKDEIEYTGKILGEKKAGKEEAKKEEKTKKEKDPDYVISGMVRNENAIVGQGAIFNVPLGEGHVVFFTFNPLERYMNHHDSSMLWNVMINWDHL